MLVLRDCDCRPPCMFILLCVLYVCKSMCLYWSSEYADDFSTNIKNCIWETIKTRTVRLYCICPSVCKWALLFILRTKSLVLFHTNRSGSVNNCLSPFGHICNHSLYQLQIRYYNVMHFLSLLKANRLAHSLNRFFIVQCCNSERSQMKLNFLKQTWKCSFSFTDLFFLWNICGCYDMINVSFCTVSKSANNILVYILRFLSLNSVSSFESRQCFWMSY